MALLDDVKVAVRVSSTATDSEIQIWIDAALADIKRVGVKEELLNESDMDALVKAAVICYAKANYGYDVQERAQFEASYRGLVCSLLNSSANVCAGESDE